MSCSHLDAAHYQGSSPDHHSLLDRGQRSLATKYYRDTSASNACAVFVIDVCTCSGRNPSPIIRAGIRRKNGTNASSRIANGGENLSLSVRTRLMTRF